LWPLKILSPLKLNLILVVTRLSSLLPLSLHAVSTVPENHITHCSSAAAQAQPSRPWDAAACALPGRRHLHTARPSDAAAYVTRPLLLQPILLRDNPSTATHRTCPRPPPLRHRRPPPSSDISYWFCFASVSMILWCFHILYLNYSNSVSSLSRLLLLTKMHQAATSFVYIDSGTDSDLLGMGTRL
jgi:hypothetical protein